MEQKKKNRSAFVDSESTKFTEHRIGSGSQELHYFKAGEGTIPLVVLYTGGIWRRPAAHELIVVERQIIRIVVPGFIHDYGEVAKEINSLDEVLDVLVQNISTLGIRQFDLMGSSLAAGFAAALALRLPEAVRKLILVSPSALFSAYKRAETSEDLRSRFLAKDSNVETPAVKQENLNTLESRVARLFSPSDSKVIETRLSSLEMPVLVIFGTDDKILVSTNGENYKALIHKVSIVHIEGAGHVPEVEKPEDFSKLVTDFLNTNCSL